MIPKITIYLPDSRRGGLHWSVQNWHHAPRLRGYTVFISVPELWVSGPHRCEPNYTSTTRSIEGFHMGEFGYH